MRASGLSGPLVSLFINSGAMKELKTDQAVANTLFVVDI